MACRKTLRFTTSVMARENIIWKMSRISGACRLRELFSLSHRLRLRMVRAVLRGSSRWWEADEDARHQDSTRRPPGGEHRFLSGRARIFYRELGQEGLRGSRNTARLRSGLPLPIRSRRPARASLPGYARADGQAGPMHGGPDFRRRR